MGGQTKESPLTAHHAKYAKTDGSVFPFCSRCSLISRLRIRFQLQVRRRLSDSVGPLVRAVAHASSLPFIVSAAAAL
jgi:hypothetical protein